MSNEPLLLPSAKSGILIEPRPISRWWRIGAITIGILVVGLGGADVVSRFGEKVLAGNTNFFAFAPAILSLDPSLIEAVTGASSATTSPLVPARLRIPSIGVNAKVEEVGKKPDGAMATPSNFTDVAWYAPGSKPGAPGNAVFAGHVNNALSMDGVFAKLKDVDMGEDIIIEDETGARLEYEVVDIVIYPANQAPAEEIFRTTGASQIVLITCDGEWDSLARSYNERLVVVARLSTL